MSCTPGQCVSPSPAQAHCAVCHQTFGGVRLFDTHRRVNADGRVICLAPSALCAVATNGVWRLPSTPEESQRLTEARRKAGWAR